MKPRALSRPGPGATPLTDIAAARARPLAAGVRGRRAPTIRARNRATGARGRGIRGRWRSAPCSATCSAMSDLPHAGCTRRSRCIRPPSFRRPATPDAASPPRSTRRSCCRHVAPLATWARHAAALRPDRGRRRAQRPWHPRSDLPRRPTGPAGLPGRPCAARLSERSGARRRQSAIRRPDRAPSARASASACMLQVTRDRGVSQTAAANAVVTTWSQ